MGDEQWENDFKQAISGIHGSCHYSESAEMLRTLLKTGLLKFTDIRDRPDRFFKAHRMLLSPTRIQEGSGFGVRFTVLYNLFAGTIMGLGTEEQIAQLDQFASQGVLGCFCLTERYAGVNSGLVVNTTATWIPEKQQFLIDCPTEGAQKNWISQGLTAQMAVVIANLIIDGKAYGPHGFVVRMREENGDLVPGIKVDDLGTKTVANDLDNAIVTFDKFYAPKDALLKRFADIVDDKYVQTTAERMRIEVIGQRLLTGRLAIAQAAVVFTGKLFEKTLEYASKKPCWAPKGQKQPMLSDIPHIKAIFDEAEGKLSALAEYNALVEEKLNVHLRASTIPEAELVEAIAVAKIKSVNTGIDLSDKLAREVGSYALMHESGFGAAPWLYMTAFAEGDSRILSQKLARDSMKAFQKSSYVSAGKDLVLGTGPERREKQIQIQLSRALSGASSPADAGRLWNENWQLVYSLADAVCDKYMSSYLGEDKILSKL